MLPVSIQWGMHAWPPFTTVSYVCLSNTINKLLADHGENHPALVSLPATPCACVYHSACNYRNCYNKYYRIASCGGGLEFPSHLLLQVLLQPTLYTSSSGLCTRTSHASEEATQCHTTSCAAVLLSYCSSSVACLRFAHALCEGGNQSSMRAMARNYTLC